MERDHVSADLPAYDSPELRCPGVKGALLFLRELVALVDSDNARLGPTLVV